MADEYLEGILNREPNPEPEYKVEWEASFNGISIYTDTSLAKGTIQFRNENHEVIGTITNIRQLRIGKAPS